MRTLRVVDSGNGNRRLGLTHEDFNLNKNNPPATKVIIQLNISNYGPLSIKALKTYNSWGSITHSDINNWIQNNDFPLQQEFIFDFNVLKNDVHQYSFVKVK